MIPMLFTPTMTKPSTLLFIIIKPSRKLKFMKKISFSKILVLALFTCGGIVQHGFAQLTVTANAHLVSSGANTQIVLQDLGLVNNGTINHSSGNVKFNGITINSISGNGALSLYNLEMNKIANSVSLSRNMVVKNQIKFTSGILNLNGYDIDLLSSGTLENERDASRITGINGGKVKITAILNAPIAVNPGNLGAVFTSTENFGTTSIQRGHQTQINDLSTGTSILRYYEITPTNNAALKATLRFNYFNTELNEIVESNLVLFKGSANGSWVEKGYTTRDATLNYVEKVNNPDFSRWTLSNTGNVLASGCPGGVPTQNFYADIDGDGYGNPNSSVSACTQPEGYVINKIDCNDDPNTGGAAIHPGAIEICNGVDDDCDGLTDENVQTVYYPDVDGDGYGNTAASIKSCAPPVGFITIGGDCNDNNATIRPGAAEVCGNFIDDNCNGQTDENCPVTTPSLSINDITENESQGTAQLTVTLSAPVAGIVKVKYKTNNGTAAHPKDFLRSTGEVVFAPGSITQFITITLVVDNKPEADEYFDVELNTAQGATIGDANGRVTITENSIVIIDASRKAGVNAELDKGGNYFNVNVSNNPTGTQFRLQVESSNKEKLIVQISDVHGRIIERIGGKLPLQAIHFGNHYRPGIYFAQIIQGGNRKTVKLIKL
jgi:hypothetical protein